MALKLFAWAVAILGAGSCFWAGTLVFERWVLSLCVLACGWISIECGIYILLTSKDRDDHQG